jgi:hypothetical protein
MNLVWAALVIVARRRWPSPPRSPSDQPFPVSGRHPAAGVDRFGERVDDRRTDTTKVGARAARSSTPPTWSTWREAVAVVVYSPHLRKTVTIALIVGTVLFAINQLDVVLRGEATAVVWIKSAVTYLVPFAVSNAGVLVATRRATTT